MVSVYLLRALTFIALLLPWLVISRFCVLECIGLY